MDRSLHSRARGFVMRHTCDIPRGGSNEVGGLALNVQALTVTTHGFPLIASAVSSFARMTKSQLVNESTLDVRGLVHHPNQSVRDGVPGRLNKGVPPTSLAPRAAPPLPSHTIRIRHLCRKFQFS